LERTDINPIDVYGLEEWGDLAVAGFVDFTYLLDNGLLIECENGIRLLLNVLEESNPQRHFTIEFATRHQR
jgi:hypothetical protein